MFCFYVFLVFLELPFTLSVFFFIFTQGASEHRSVHGYACRFTNGRIVEEWTTAVDWVDLNKEETLDSVKVRSNRLP